MSKITRWKPEKTKIKVVFRLQVHATHIPQSRWDKLFVSFIPADTGKATAKTTKSNVRNGKCKWADPIYETTRLLQDPRTKHFDQKLYKLVVSMGSSRSSILGEAIINLADYADALKPSSVALPLQGCDSGTILHVTVQLLTSKTGFREFEQQRESRERGLLTASDNNSRNESIPGRPPSSEDTISDHLENSRVNLRGHPLHEEETAHSEDHVGYPMGFDGSSNTSESLYAGKHGMPSPHEIDSQNSDQKYTPTHGRGDCIHSWGSGNYTDNDLAIAYEENSRLRRSLDLAESSLHDLKLELNSLQSPAGELEVEAQKFTKMLAAEMASGENLAREVAILKAECSMLKSEVEALKDSNSKLMSSCDARESAGNVDEPIHQDLQLRWLKGFLLLEDKIEMLLDKATSGFADMDLRLLSSDLETALAMLKDLKQGRPAMKEEVVDSNLHQSEEHESRFDLGTDLRQPESILHHSPDLTNSTRNRMDGLVRELEESKAERENLMQKMSQMECYYEALIQELEGNERQMLGELQNMRNEHSVCLYAVSSTNTETLRMKQDMNEKPIMFTEEKQQLDALNKELEIRAVTAESVLKTARLNYSIAVVQLLEDLGILSFQVSSMYEASQNLVKEAFQDPKEDNRVGASKSQALVQKKQKLGGEALLDDLGRSLNSQDRKVDDEVQDVHYENVYLDIFSKTLLETLHGNFSDKSAKVSEMDEASTQFAFYKNSNDVLMLKLQCSQDEVESLNKEKSALSAKYYDMNEWNEKFEASLRSVTDENGCLMQKIAELEDLLVKETEESCDLRKGNIALQEKLTNFMHDFHKLESAKGTLEALNKEKIALSAKFYEMSIWNEDLEASLRSMTEENNCLLQKINELENLLKKETANSGDLRTGNAELQEKLAKLTHELQEMDSVKENFEKQACYLQEEMRGLQTAYNEKVFKLSGETIYLAEDRETAHSSFSTSETANLEKVVSDLQEKMQDLLLSHDEKVSQLLKEVEIVTRERDNAYASLSALESEKENLGKTVSDLRQTLHVLLNYHDKNFDWESLDLFALISQLEKFHKTAVSEIREALCIAQEEISDLTEQNKVLLKERDAAQALLSSSETEKNKLKNFVSVLEDKLWDLIVNCDKTVDGSSLNSSDALLLLDEYHQNASQKIDKLMGENEVLARELELAELSLSQSVSAFCAMKEDSECNLRHMQSKINMSDNLVQDLQSKLEMVTGRLNACLNNEEVYKDQQRGSIADFDRSISEVEQVLLMNKDLSREIFSLQHIGVELQQSKLDVAELAEEKGSLTLSLQEKTEESACLMLELTQLRESLTCLNKELQRERFCRESLEGSITDLTSQLNEAHWLPDFDQQNAELAHLRQLVSDLGLEKLRLCNLLSQKEEFIKITSQDSCSVKCLENQLTEMHGQLIASDIQLTFSLAQYRRLMSTEEDVDNLVISIEEREVERLVLRGKHHELCSKLSLMETEYEELNERLSAQVRKTEELKNLSTHLKELKEAAEAECVKARQKKKSEGSSFAAKESLRIAFLKEQYETKIQELKQQLSISMRHSEDMLLKLQDAVDEIENRKRLDVSNLRKNEELSMKISDLESELQEIVSDKREKAKAYDCMKAEMECSLISLECCKEENQKLEASLQECYEKKSKIEAELMQVKEQLEISKTGLSISEFSCAETPDNERRRDYSLDGDEADSCSDFSAKMHVNQESIPRGDNGVTSLALVNGENFLDRNAKDSLIVSNRFKVQSLRSSMDNLTKALEKMKSENCLLPHEYDQFNAKFPELERELTQLEKANRELGSIYPSFNEFGCSGNPLERVFALELELAGALRAKKNNIQFESSFFGQHSDEAAIFKSFKDINDLIKDMLELKAKYSVVESELKEMHGRYSQLSLQLAEVEGQRQKLVMTLKCTRTSRNPLSPHRSSPASLEENLS